MAKIEDIVVARNLQTLPSEEVNIVSLVPSHCTIISLGEKSHSSLITIFILWNSMMGSTLLTVAWGFQKAGLLAGALSIIVVTLLSMYTAIILLTLNEKYRSNKEEVLPDLINHFIGYNGQLFTQSFLILTLAGVITVYFIFLCNVTYFQVESIYVAVESIARNVNIAEDTKIVCTETSAPKNAFQKYWNLQTVPLYVGFAIYWVLNMKNPTCFARFTSIGTISIFCFIAFIAYKAAIWGINIPNIVDEVKVRPTFMYIVGMICFACDTHCIILNLFKRNKNQANNKRDLCIAFLVTGFTYVVFGGWYYAAFPLSKSCISDNMLNNFKSNNILAIILRFMLMAQMITLIPLFAFFAREHTFRLFTAVLKNEGYGRFKYKKVFIFNLILITICILFAIFLPTIGNIIRFVGAFSGLVYVFLVPCTIKLLSLKYEGKLKVLTCALHIGLIIFGIIIFISQAVLSFI